MVLQSKFSTLALVTTMLCCGVSELALATSLCSVSALDTVAGLGTQVTIMQCDADKSVSMTIRGPNDTPYTQTIRTDAVGNAQTLVPSYVTMTAGAYTVTIAGVQSSFSVTADRADDTQSSLSVSKTTLATNGAENATVTALLQDRYGNVVIGRPLALLSNRTTDEITAMSSQTDEQGKFLWTVRPIEQGTMTLIVYDIISGKQMKLTKSIVVGSSASWQRASLTGSEQGGDDIAGDVRSSAVDRFELELPQQITEVKANDLFNMTIRAMRGTTLVRSYIGTLIVTSSDPDADLPKKGSDPKSPTTGRIDMRNVDQGERKVPLSFALRRKGKQTITVTDALDPTIRGELTLTVLRGDGAEETIVIVDPKDRASIKASDTVLLQGKAPSLINLKVKGGKEIVDGESDAEGVFRITVPLHPEDKEVTLFVTSENGTYESNPVHLIIDTSIPKTDSITFDPPEGKTGDIATVHVRAEAGLKKVTATIGTLSLNLAETESGVYSAKFNAPQIDQVYDVTILTEDAVGNQATTLLKWTVKPRTLPVVQGVTAQAQTSGIQLSWKAVQGTIAEYKIYIAAQADPANALYSIATQKAVTSAVVRDLSPGQAYLFSVTAIDGEGNESPERSASVSATPLGFSLKGTPSNDSVLLEWNTLPSLPVTQFTLEYGTEPGHYPEKRTIEGTAISTMVRDLLPGVTYEFKLTPVAVTGKVLTELAAITRVPLAKTAGFTMGNGDPAPDTMFQPLHSGAMHQPEPKLRDVPQTVDSGLSSLLIIVALLLAATLGWSWLKLKKEQRAVQEFLHLLHQRHPS